MRAAQRWRRDQRVRRLVAAGKSYRETAAAVGLRSPASVHAIVNRGRGVPSGELSELERWRAHGIPDASPTGVVGGAGHYVGGCPELDP